MYNIAHRPRCFALFLYFPVFLLIFFYSFILSPLFFPLVLYLSIVVKYKHLHASPRLIQHTHINTIACAAFKGLLFLTGAFNGLLCLTSIKTFKRGHNNNMNTIFVRRYSYMNIQLRNLLTLWYIKHTCFDKICKLHMTYVTLRHLPEICRSISIKALSPT